jgi:hypothetical protein
VRSKGEKKDKPDRQRGEAPKDIPLSKLVGYSRLVLDLADCDVA